MKLGFIPVRKKGKLPPTTVQTTFEYVKEYGKDELELPKLINNEEYKDKNFYIIDDIYATGNTVQTLKKEIEKLGGKVILIPPYQKVFKYHKELKKILKEGNYKIVHSHINTLSVFSLFAAKCAGVPVRIAHSHSTTNKQEKKKNLVKQVLRPFSKVFATD